MMYTMPKNLLSICVNFTLATQQELADYYNTAIVPARVRRPKYKSSAETSVRFAETWIIAALRDMKFFSLQEVKEAIAEKWMS